MLWMRTRWRRSRWLGKEASVLHLDHAFLERRDDLLDVSLTVCRGEEAGETFQDVNAFRAQIVIEQTCKAFFRRETEIEDASEVFDAGRNVILFEERVQPQHHSGCGLVEPLLQCRTLLLKVDAARL